MNDKILFEIVVYCIVGLCTLAFTIGLVWVLSGTTYNVCMLAMDLYRQWMKTVAEVEERFK